MSEYMDETHPDAFKDMEKKSRPDLRFPGKIGNWVECGRCQGHGGWNLKLHAYKRQRNGADIGCEHFQTACGSCWGWGWVPKGQCLHKWGGKWEDSIAAKNGMTRPKLFRCESIWVCVKCGEHRVVDSSD